jgi:gliding motility-associated-like protein
MILAFPQKKERRKANFPKKRNMRPALFTLLFLAGTFAAHAIDVTFTFTAPACNGFSNGTATANPSGGTGPYAFAWSNGQTGQTVLGVAAGVYTCTVTDQTGAVASGSVTVTQPPALVVNFSQPAANCGSFQPVTANVTGGAGPYSYVWSTGGNTATIMPTAAGNVFVTVTDANGCAVAETYYVPVVSQIFTSFFAAPPTCAGGNNGQVVPNIVGNYLPHTWVWSTGTNANGSLSNVPSGNYGITITDQQGCTKAETIVVPTQAPVQVFALMTNAKCHGTASGVGTALGSGGVSPYNYTWSTTQTDQIIQNLAVGNYTVTLVDGNGCSATSTGTINQPDPLVTTVVNVTPACGNSGSITVQPSGGTPPYSLVWNGGLYTGTSVSGLPAGNYYICTMDANSCQLDINVVVPGGPGLDVSIATEKATCVGLNDGTATAVVQGGSGNFQYIWSNGGPNYPVQNGLAAGTTLTVTVVDLNTNCTGSASAFIQTHGQISLEVIDTDVFCPNDATGTATVNAVSGTAPFNYIWTVNGMAVNQQSISGLTAGAYPVVVVDAQGCKAFGVADINATGAAMAQLSIHREYCEGDSVLYKLTDLSTANGNQITGWNWTVSWNTGATTFNTQNPSNIWIPANSNGLVQLTVTSATGCTDDVAYPFTVPEDVEVSIAGNNPAVNCAGAPSMIEIEGDSTYTYTWSPTTNLTFVNNNPQTVSANPSQNTVYQLIATKNGCSDTLQVQVIKSTPFEVDLGAPVIPTCDITQLLSAQLNVNIPNTTVVWVNAAGDSIATGNNFMAPATGTPTTYGVIVTDANGCSDTDQVSVVSNGVDVQASIVGANSACANTPLQFGVVNTDPTDILIYNWAVSPAGATISDPIAANPTISGAAGTYTVTVTVTNQFGCTKTMTATVTYGSSVNIAGQIGNDLCNGLNAAFSNNSSVAGVWNFGDGQSSTLQNPTHVYTTAGQYIVTFTPNDACYLPFKDTIQVYATPSVVAAIQSAVLDCQNTATVGFTDATQHVTAIATWQWNFSTGQTSNQQNPTLTIPAEGTVSATLVVVDINGCRDTSDAATLEIDIVNENVDSLLGVCPGLSIALNPSPNSNYTYNWTATPADPTLVGNQGNPTVTPSQTTTYSVSITNGNCTVAETATVELYEPANLLASRDTVLCENNSVEITAVSTNAVGFAWSNNVGFNPIFANTQTTTVQPNNTGMNYVRATTAQGCSAIDSTMVLLGNPDVAASTLDPTYVCNGVSAEIAVINNDPNDVLTYAWSNGLPANATQNVAPTAATTYTVVATNQYGCTESLSFAVSPIAVAVTITVDGKATICPGESATLTANPAGGTAYSYTWVPANNIDNPTNQTVVVTPDVTTDYMVQLTDNASGCTTVGSTTITVISPECIDPFIFVPNAFTPNEDGNNDRFRVRGVNMTELYFVVWDRWGEKIYETEQVDHIGWDGIFNGVASTPDSYAWYARVRCGNGQVWEKKGNVTLVR